jgi:hypothetical protein
MSLIALPIILVLGLISLMFRACAGEGKDAWNEMILSFKSHIYVMIPTSVVGIFTPLKTSNSVRESLVECLQRSEIPDEYRAAYDAAKETEDAVESDQPLDTQIAAMQRAMNALPPEARVQAQREILNQVSTPGYSSEHRQYVMSLMSAVNP